MTIIHLGPPLPVGSSGTPRSAERATLNVLLYLALLRMGFTWPALSPGPPVRSYRTLSALPYSIEYPAASSPKREFGNTGPVGGGLLSVALAFGSPRLGVTQHPALWSSDFPPVEKTTGDRQLFSNLTMVCASEPYVHSRLTPRRMNPVTTNVHILCRYAPVDHC